jgi:hypothetical protein
MYQDFETDVMDDLFYEAAEGPSQLSRRHGEAFDAYEDMDTYDEFDVDDAYDDGGAFDALEDEMADALEAEDSDEFFRRIARGIRSAAQVARRVGRGVGQVARVVAPIASAIPLPQAQAIARVARVAGRLLADGADEFEAVDALVDLAEAEDVMDAAAPAIASMAIRGTMPQAARLPAATRRQMVQATTRAAQRLATQQGPQAVRALPGVVQTAQRIVQQQGLPPRALPQVIQRVGTRISRNPQLLRRLLRTAGPGLRRRICAECGRPQAHLTSRRVAM